jgi:hypothetical protein
VALAQLRARGFPVVETDGPDWSVWSEANGGYVWRANRIAELLSRAFERPLYVSGTVSNQAASTRTPTPWCC